MTDKQIVEKILKHKIIVIVRNIPQNALLPFCEALVKGGIHLVECPFLQHDPNRIENNSALIRAIADHFKDDIIPGAGTVLSLPELNAAAQAGAKFMLAPSSDKTIVEETKKMGLVSIPGVLTPTEAQNAYLWGADLVKIFPTDILGVGYLKALRVPLSHIKMVAMGGVKPENLLDVLKYSEAVGISTAVCNPAWIEAGNYAAVTEAARRFTEQIEID